MQMLGNTLAEIAREKAGIIKPGVPVVCYPPETEEVRKVFADTAAERGAPLTVLKRKQVYLRETGAKGSAADYVMDSRTWNELKISLPGEHQAMNALTALAVLEELEKQGKKTFWPGRLEWCGNVLMDGAHNAQGVRALRAFTEKHLAGSRKVLLTGVLKEKLTEEMLDGLRAVADEAVTVTPDTPRAMKAEELAGKLREKGMEARAANSLREGLEKARELAGGDGIVLATGSLYFIGALRSLLGLKP